VWCPLDDGAWVAAHADFDMALTEGAHSWVHMHGISTLGVARRELQVALHGLAGGTIVKGGVNRAASAAALSDDVDVQTALQFERFRAQYTWPGLSDAEERVACLGDWARDLPGRAFAALRVQVAEAMAWRADLRDELLALRHHELRLFLHFATLLRSHVEAPTPYCDWDLVRVVYGQPAALRGYRRLQVAATAAAMPALVGVRDTREELPLAGRGRRTAAWLLHRLRAAVRRTTGLGADVHPLHTDYEEWARTDLRPWCEEILFGPRTAARGIFNPAFLQVLWARLLSRQEPDMIGKLAPIMSYELMLRALVDR
jgi:asparagine synthase (glutamine-hydrolysing)